MELLYPSIDIEPINNEIYSKLERITRVCYKSEDKITADSYITLLEKIIKSGHHSVLEHCNISVRIICDRSVSHAIVRHRLVSYSQESTIYCDYNKGEHSNIKFIIPEWCKNIKPGIYTCANIDIKNTFSIEEQIWFLHMFKTEDAYKKLRMLKIIPKNARKVLPLSLKTELVMTANIREWRHILKIRTHSKGDDDQMISIMRQILEQFKLKLPILFNDIPYND